MHQQVLLSRRRVAVGRLQALVLSVKVRHGGIGLQFHQVAEPTPTDWSTQKSRERQGEGKSVEGLQVSGKT